MRDDWLRMSLIDPALIEKDEELVDDDRYFSYRTKSENKNEDEDKYKYKIQISVIEIDNVINKHIYDYNKKIV